MARSAASCSVSCASYFAASRKVLHKNALPDEAAPVFISLRRGKPFYFAMKHCSVTLHNMKHSAHAPYDLSSIALRATDDEKMKNESCVCKYSLSMLHYPAERSMYSLPSNLPICIFYLRYSLGDTLRWDLKTLPK